MIPPAPEPVVGKRSGQRVLRATGILASSSALVALLGLLKNLLAAYYFGTTREMDIYLLALVLPDMASYLATSGLFNFVPLIAEVRAREGEEAALRTASKLTTFWLGLLGLALLLCALFTPLLVGLLAPGFDPALQGDVVAHTRRLLLMAAALGVARVMAALLLERKRFFVLSLGEVAFQVGSIAYLVLFHSRGIESLVFGMIFGALLQVLVTASGMSSMRLRADLDLGDPVVRKMLKLTVPVYVGSAASQLNQLIIRAIASSLAAGAISAINYASYLVVTVAEGIGLSLARALFPYMSQQIAEQDTATASRSLNRGVVGICLVMLPASVGLAILARPVIRLLLQRGAFDAASTDLTHGALVCFSPGLVAIALNYVMGTLYYARQDTITPAWTALVRIAVAALGSWLLAPHFAQAGVAGAMTLGHFVKLALMVAVLRGGPERAALRETTRSLQRVALASALMAAVVFPLSRLGVLSGSETLLQRVVAVAVPVLAGVLVYAGAIWLLVRSEFDYALRSLRSLVAGERGRRPADAAGS